MSAASGITVANAEFDALIANLVRTSKRAAVDVLKQQARLLFVEVAKVTPPNGGKSGNTLQGREAERAGKLAIERDVRMIYATPSRAYTHLGRAAGKARADAFWAAHKEGRDEAAAKIIRADLKKSFSPFDGGKLAKSRRFKRNRKEPVYFVQNPDEMVKYIREMQGRVWYLASGWKDALLALGVKSLPYGIRKQNGPGLLKVEISDERIVITMINNVSYARQISKLQAQIAFAMRVRSGALQRSWDDYMNKLKGVKK